MDAVFQLLFEAGVLILWVENLCRVRSILLCLWFCLLDESDVGIEGMGPLLDAMQGML